MVSLIESVDNRCFYNFIVLCTELGLYVSTINGLPQGINYINFKLLNTLHSTGHIYLRYKPSMGNNYLTPLDNASLYFFVPLGNNIQFWAVIHTTVVHSIKSMLVYSNTTTYCTDNHVK